MKKEASTMGMGGMGRMPPFTFTAETLNASQFTTYTHFAPATEVLVASPKKKTVGRGGDWRMPCKEAF